jgi:hypothetical protein
MTDDVLVASIDDLVGYFRGALLAIAPVAALAKIGYRDDAMHPDWEGIAGCLFDAFVRSPIESDVNQSGAELPVAKYDIDLDDYIDASWIGIETNGSGETAFVRFLSIVNPFDTVQVVDVDPETLVAGERRTLPWTSGLFLLRRHLTTGGVTTIERIQADE